MADFHLRDVAADRVVLSAAGGDSPFMPQANLTKNCRDATCRVSANDCICKSAADSQPTIELSVINFRLKI